jgi:hypothetical protein
MPSPSLNPAAIIRATLAAMSQGITRLVTSVATIRCEKNARLRKMPLDAKQTKQLNVNCLKLLLGKTLFVRSMLGSLQIVAYSNTSSIQRDKRLYISGLFNSLPAGILKESERAVADYVVDCYARSENLSFHMKDKYVMSKKPRGVASTFANANVFRYNCSQQYRAPRVSTLPYSRTRNRRGRVHLVNCQGSILVTFPSTSTSLDFDIAFELQHSLHPGREYFGVPVSIREWIKAHPFSTPKAQRDELLRAIERGEIEGVSEKYLSGPMIHYWWRKVYKEKTYISKDSWENIVHMLEKHPLVVYLFSTTNSRQLKSSLTESHGFM